MARLTDPAMLARYQIALANWQFTGYIEWKETARDWLVTNLGPIPLREIGRLMYVHVTAGGEIDQVTETRPEWSEFDFHYDFRFPIAERLIYIETILRDDDSDDPTILVVSIHDA
jgi:hypothetical protein